MSKIILEKTIRSEIRKVNDIIDLKILKGIPYKREAMRHRFLLSRLSDMHKLPRFSSGWFQKTVNVIASFVL